MNYHLFILLSGHFYFDLIYVYVHIYIFLAFIYGWCDI